MRQAGFTLMEIIITIAIIGLLSALAVVYLIGSRDKARDTKRKADIAQIGRYLSLSCFMPRGGPGDYDLAEVAAEIIITYPQFQNFLSNLPQDPKTGTNAQTNYRYVVDEQNRCALYANLEYKDEPVTLTNLNVPTPGGGQGVLRSASEGWNGTALYFQFSN